MKKSYSGWLLAAAFSSVLLLSCGGGGGGSDEAWSDASCNSPENVTVIINNTRRRTFSTWDDTLNFKIYSSAIGEKGYNVSWKDENGNAITEDTMPADSSKKYTFYATLAPISYTVKFDADGHSGSLPSQISCKYDQEFTVPRNSLSASGKYALGWSTESGGKGRAYSAGAKAKNLTQLDGEAVTLYPYFVADSDLCTITIESEFGGLSSDEKTVKVPRGWTAGWGDTYDYNLPTLTDSVNSFNYWRYSTDGGATEKTLGEKTPLTITSDTKFKAYWAKTCTVSFITEYGTAPQAMKVKTNTMLNIEGSKSVFESKYWDNEFVPKITYQPDIGQEETCSTWRCGDKTVGGSNGMNTILVEDDITLTADWSGIKKITLNFMKGTTPKKVLTFRYSTTVYPPDTSYCSPLSYKLPLPTASGYCFTGWICEGAAEPLTNSKSISDDTEFTATWVQGGAVGITVTLPAASTADINLAYSDHKLTASFSGVTTFEWHVNGTKVSEGASFNVLSNYNKLIENQVNSIMAVATVSGKTYSATALVKRN